MDNGVVMIRRPNVNDMTILRKTYRFLHSKMFLHNYIHENKIWDGEALFACIVKMVCEAFGVPSLFNLVSSKWPIADEFGYSLVENYFTKIEGCCSGEDDK